MRFFIFFAIILLPSFFGNCCSSDKCRRDNKFSIELCSGGGFTGLNRGITIHSDGSVRKWTRMPGEEPVLTDSLTLKSGELDTLCSLAAENDTSGYAISETGNFTTVLSITFNDKTSVVSFAGADPPAGFPRHLTELIAAIRKIK